MVQIGMYILFRVTVLKGPSHKIAKMLNLISIQQKFCQKKLHASSNFTKSSFSEGAKKK